MSFNPDNITRWDNRKLNFWSIPKAGSTSIKQVLTDKVWLKDTININKTAFYIKADKWVHDYSISTYISKQQAVTNTYSNFSVIRNPINRFLSQYAYNLKIKIVKAPYIDQLLFLLETTHNNDLDIHFKSQCSYVSYQNQIIPKLFKLENLTLLSDYLDIKHIPKLNNSTFNQLKLSTRQVTRLETIIPEDFELYESV